MSKKGGVASSIQYVKRNNRKFFILIFWWYYLPKGLIVRKNLFSDQGTDVGLWDKKAETYMTEEEIEPPPLKQKLIKMRADNGNNSNKNTNQLKIGILYAVSFPVSFGVLSLIYNTSAISNIPEMLAILVMFTVGWSLYQFLPTLLFVVFLKLRYNTMTIITIIMIPVMILLKLEYITIWSIPLGILGSTQLGFAFGKIVQTLIRDSDDSGENSQLDSEFEVTNEESYEEKPQ